MTPPGRPKRFRVALSFPGELQELDTANRGLGYSNLSQLHLTLGNVPEAVTAARQSVDFADRSGEWTQRVGKRTTLADAFHQSGDLAEATRLFSEAERQQAENQPECPILYSWQIVLALPAVASRTCA